MKPTTKKKFAIEGILAYISVAVVEGEPVYINNWATQGQAFQFVGDDLEEEEVDEKKQEPKENEQQQTQIGQISLNSYNYPNHNIRHRNYQLWIDPLEQRQLYKQDATWEIVKGLYGKDTVSIRSSGKYSTYYARHGNFTLQISPNSNEELFKKDASFYERPSLIGDSNYVSFESVNYPGHYI